MRLFYVLLKMILKDVILFYGMEEITIFPFISRTLWLRLLIRTGPVTSCCIFQEKPTWLWRISPSSTKWIRHRLKRCGRSGKILKNMHLKLRSFWRNRPLWSNHRKWFGEKGFWWLKTARPWRMAKCPSAPVSLPLKRLKPLRLSTRVHMRRVL